ncbi:hypothetical protein EI290_02860 [Hymenobacter metallilatus]|uniref:Uncharacterized protein n=1 Tax=Hymenobacter metallilatus TaxID=2493666 RepID=A0A428JUK3_9BACT|nr:hypothetical protein EI290_02860 [Hymenobacter metallilatus]
MLLILLLVWGVLLLKNRCQRR